jgi:hypothetical protein
MSTEKKLSIGFENNALVAGFDNNKDGENSVAVNIFFAEGVKEIFAKGTPVEGVAKFKLSMEGAKVVMTFDSDMDNSPVASIVIDLAEGADEVLSSLKK